MKRFAWIGVGVVALAVGIVGCSWETGDDATSWSSSYNWVNFSGTYRNSTGPYLVTDYTTTPGSEAYTEEKNGSAEGSGVTAVSAAGNLGKAKIVPGSVLIKLYAANGNLHSSYSDNGNGVLSGGVATGNVSYDAGSWNVDFSAGLNGPAGGTWKATFRYYVYQDGTAPSGQTAGSTRVSIYVFNVTHSGQNLTFVDNNGSAYTGKIGAIRSASGAENTDIEQVANDEKSAGKITYYESELPEDGDSVIATFECSGVSAAMMQVKIVGSFQGTVASGVFTGRTLTGTWIELGGKTGDVRGQTTAIEVQTAAETPAVTDSNAVAVATE